MLSSAVLCLALNMYHEARGEGIDGMVAVGEVTLNRVESPRYPDNVCAVVKQRRQFSWYRGNLTPPNNEAYLASVEIAEVLLSDEDDEIRLGLEATHFHNSSVNPRWSREFVLVGVIGNHRFYKE